MAKKFKGGCLTRELRRLNVGSEMLVDLSRYNSARNAVSLMSKVSGGAVRYVTTTVGVPTGYFKIRRCS